MESDSDTLLTQTASAISVLAPPIPPLMMSSEIPDEIWREIVIAAIHVEYSPHSLFLVSTAWNRVVRENLRAVYRAESHDLSYEDTEVDGEVVRVSSLHCITILRHVDESEWGPTIETDISFIYPQARCDWTLIDDRSAVTLQPPPNTSAADFFAIVSQHALDYYAEDPLFDHQCYVTMDMVVLPTTMSLPPNTFVYNPDVSLGQAARAVVSRIIWTNILKRVMSAGLSVNIPLVCREWHKIYLRRLPEVLVSSVAGYKPRCHDYHDDIIMMCVHVHMRVVYHLRSPHRLLRYGDPPICGYEIRMTTPRGSAAWLFNNHSDDVFMELCPPDEYGLDEWCEFCNWLMTKTLGARSIFRAGCYESGSGRLRRQLVPPPTDYSGVD
jgi:hypothetical protein